MHNQKWQALVFGILLLCIELTSAFAQDSVIERSLSLQEAVQRAMQANLELLTAKKNITLSKHAVKQARSQLSPQIGVNTYWLQVDEDRAKVSYAGQQAQHEIVAVISATQLLYSEPVQANIDIQHHLQRATEENVKQLKLDIIYETMLAYIDLCRAQSLTALQQTYLDETQHYLAHAEAQHQQAEIYRWKNAIASYRKAHIAAQAEVQQAKMQLNRILHQSLEDNIVLPELNLTHPLSLISNNTLLKPIHDAEKNKIFRDFMVEEGFNNSPQLKQLEAEIKAQTRTVLSARRASWSPTVALQGDIRHSVNRFGVNSEVPEEMNDTDWYISANVFLPLYDGGEKNTALARSQQNLSRLRLQRQAVQERIETAIRSALHQFSATYTTIDLARETKQIAQQHLDLITQQYMTEQADIHTLLDAQEILLDAKTMLHNAIYDSLKAMAMLQHNVGFFHFLMQPQEQTAWQQRLDIFLSQHQ